MRLSKLYLQSFRGATKPVTFSFDPEKKITMLFAENGNGKSTFADALTCLCTDKLGSLDDKSSVDRSFLKSAGAANETKIVLQTDEGNFQAAMASSAKIFTKNPITGQPDIKSLRRSQIISLINTQASDRYTALKDYLDISHVYNGEESLRKLHRETERDLALAISNLQVASSTLEKSWQEENSPGDDMLSWAEERSKTDISKETKDHNVLQVLVSQGQALVNKHNEIIQHKTNLVTSLSARVTATQTLQSLQAASNKNTPVLLTLLQDAKIYLSSDEEINKCPVCENPMVKAAVIKSLTTQIEAMSTLDKASKDLQNTSRAYDKFEAVLNNAINHLHIQLKTYHSSISKYAQKVPEIIPFVNGISDDASLNYELYLNNSKPLQDLHIRITSSANLKKKTIDQHTFIKNQHLAILQNTIKVNKLSALFKAAKDALDIVETARKDFYDNELLSISSEVEQMYQKIHPSEGLGGIRLFLNPKYKSSLELQADFHGQKGITPQSVYSESHLDTLGICIFLALAKKYSYGKTILVLDDVVMSVDENHLDRFIQLLHDEADHFAHIIITTHYRPWKDRYRNNRAPASNVHFMELRGWSPENGIRIFNGKIALDELQTMLKDPASFHRENIASASGRILENLLDFITIKFGCRLPRKPKNDYMLSELLDGLSANLLKHCKIQHLTADSTGSYTVIGNEVLIKPIIDSLKSLKAVRNQVGAHYQFDGSLVSDKDVEDLGKETVALAELLVCPISGSLPDRNITGAYWQTKTGTIRLYPLSEPPK